MEIVLEPWVSRLRAAGTLLQVADAAISGLESLGYTSVVVVATAGDGRRSTWIARRSECPPSGGDEAVIAELRRTARPVSPAPGQWIVPLVGCGELIGEVLVEAPDARDRSSELALVGLWLSVRLAALGLDGPLQQHVRAPMTMRQREVAYLVSRGCTNSEIARMLAISIDTVKRHVSRACASIGASNRAELAAHVGDRPLHNATVPKLVVVEKELTA